MMLLLCSLANATQQQDSHSTMYVTFGSPELFFHHHLLEDDLSIDPHQQ